MEPPWCRLNEPAVFGDPIHDAPDELEEEDVVDYMHNECKAAAVEIEQMHNTMACLLCVVHELKQYTDTAVAISGDWRLRASPDVLTLILQFATRERGQTRLQWGQYPQMRASVLDPVLPYDYRHALHRYFTDFTIENREDCWRLVARRRSLMQSQHQVAAELRELTRLCVSMEATCDAITERGLPVDPRLF